MAQMVRVWRNECLRVFHDRLINGTDKLLVSLWRWDSWDPALTTGPSLGCKVWV